MNTTTLTLTVATAMTVGLLGVFSYASALKPVDLPADQTSSLTVDPFDPTATRVSGEDLQPAINQFLLEAQAADEAALSILNP